MATSFQALGDQGVGTLSERALRFADRAHLMQHEDAAGPQPLDPGFSKAEEQADRGDTLVETDLEVRSSSKRQKQIDRDWSIAGELPRSFDLGAKRIRRQEPERPETAGPGDRTGKRRPRHASHTGLDDGRFQRKLPDQVGHRRPTYNAQRKRRSSNAAVEVSSSVSTTIVNPV
jgi:hypothetical protein